jgi:hypothetical protein
MRAACVKCGGGYRLDERCLPCRKAERDGEIERLREDLANALADKQLAIGRLRAQNDALRAELDAARALLSEACRHVPYTPPLHNDADIRAFLAASGTVST